MASNRNILERRCDRIASAYDILDVIPERLFYSAWRRRLWSNVVGERILEIGVGTGKNMRFYPGKAQVTAIDISSKMLEKAAARVGSRPDVNIELVKMDIEDLDFDASSFDAVVGSFVLTVVPTPLKALGEVKRVCKPQGNLGLLEFTRSDSRLVGCIQDLVTPLTSALYGAYVGRDPVRLLRGSDFTIVEVEGVIDDMVRIIRATPS